MSLRSGSLPPLWAALVMLALGGAACSPAETVQNDCCRVALLSFEDVIPAGARLGLSWHGIGMDHRGRVYAGLGTGEERRGGVGDVLMIRMSVAGRNAADETIVGVAENA